MEFDAPALAFLLCLLAFEFCTAVTRVERRSAGGWAAILMLGARDDDGVAVAVGVGSIGSEVG